MPKFRSLKTTLISGSYHAFLPSDCSEIHFWIITVLPNRKIRKKKTTFWNTDRGKYDKMSMAKQALKVSLESHTHHFN